MVIKAALIVAAISSMMGATSSARSQEHATDKQLRAFRVWAKAVREEFIYYRSREDDLLNVRRLDPLDVKEDLARNLHQELAPETALMAIARREPAAINYENCRIAIRSCRWITVTSQQVDSVRNTSYVRDAKQYLKDANTCERGIGLAPSNNQFRDVIGILN